MANPGINELQNPEKFELVAKLDHDQIKEFVINQLSGGGRMVKVFMVYQVLMLILAAYTITHATIEAFNNNLQPIYYSMSALILSFTVLIVIHELIHGIAIKLTGAEKVNYGAYFRKFIFYAEADQHVLNKTQFAFIALAPFVAIKILTISGILVFLNHPIVYFLIIVMSAHSLFCAGDIGLLSVFNAHGNSEIFTFDVKAEKKSYYFKRI